MSVGLPKNFVDFDQREVAESDTIGDRLFQPMHMISESAMSWPGHDIIFLLTWPSLLSRGICFVDSRWEVGNVDIVVWHHSDVKYSTFPGACDWVQVSYT